MRAYLVVVKSAQARRLTLSLLPVRLGYAMVSLAVVLLVEERTGSFTTAGLALGMFSLGAGISAPLRGALIDRFGQTRPLMVYLPLFCLTFAMLTVAHTPLAMVILCAVAGLSSPPIIASARPLWRDVVGHENVRTAYALDSVMVEVTMIAGPPIAAVVVGLTRPSIAIWMISALVLVGGAMFVSVPVSRSWRAGTKTHASSPLQSKGVRTLMLASIGLGFAFGGLEIGLPGLSASHGDASGSGVLLAALAVGSAAGGIWVGTVRDRIRPVRGTVVSMAMFAALLIPVALVPHGPALLISLVLVGIAFGPANVFLLELVDRVAPPGTEVSTFTWIVALESAGVTAGAAVAGRIVDGPGAATAIALSAAAAATIPFVLHLRRASLIAGQWAAADHVVPVPTETSSGTFSG